KRGFTGAGWTNDTEAFTGREAERDTLQHEMAGSRHRDADVVDDKAALRALRENLDVRSPGAGHHDPVEPAVGDQGHSKCLPTCNRPLDGSERTSEQQGGGEDDTGTSALFKH